VAEEAADVAADVAELSVASAAEVSVASDKRSAQALIGSAGQARRRVLGVVRWRTVNVLPDPHHTHQPEKTPHNMPSR